MRLRLLGLVTAGLVLVTSCTNAASNQSQGPAQGINPQWPYLGKGGVVEAPRAMVVSGNVIASEVGATFSSRGATRSMPPSPSGWRSPWSTRKPATSAAADS